MNYNTIKTPIGVITLFFNEKEMKLREILLPGSKPGLLENHSRVRVPSQFEKLFLNLFKQKKAFEFPLSYLDLSGDSTFRNKILKTLIERVPYGKVVTYSGLASMAGYKNAARAVGSVMSSNRFPLMIPCHRVVRADRTPGCFMGGENGTRLKIRLLQMENIDFDLKGRVLRKFLVED